MSLATSLTDLPDIGYCRRQGWILADQPAPRRGLSSGGLPVSYHAEYQAARRKKFTDAGLTMKGTPRKYRPKGSGLTPLEYQDLRRQKFLAAGLTVNGAPRKRARK